MLEILAVSPFALSSPRLSQILETFLSVLSGLASLGCGYPLVFYALQIDFGHCSSLLFAPSSSGKTRMMDFEWKIHWTQLDLHLPCHTDCSSQYACRAMIPVVDEKILQLCQMTLVVSKLLPWMNHDYSDVINNSPTSAVWLACFHNENCWPIVPKLDNLNP